MSRKVVGGIDNQGQRLRGVGAPTATDDGVPRSFIRYDLSLACVGKPDAGEIIGSLVAPVAFTLPANLSGSIARALTAAAASAAWTLTRIPSGSTTEATIATLTFAASATVATFSTQAAVSIAAGDILRLKAPASQDSALSDVSFTFAGTR